jgi:alpha-D-ribose 1-methylphosphonate 5-triphosphate synthase subunit PhnH
MSANFAQARTPGHPDLAALGAGFSDMARGSQAVFRSVLQAMSHPGRLVAVACDAQMPAACNAASAAVLLALLDAETSLWLSPSLAGGTAQTWLRFHTGCTLVNDSRRAQFVWAASLDELPEPDALSLGTDASPELAVTCVVDVPALLAGQEPADWVLSGPGILQTAGLSVPGASADSKARLLARLQASHALFPRGMDVLLASPTHIVGLPRTTRLMAEGG